MHANHRANESINQVAVYPPSSMPTTSGDASTTAAAAPDPTVDATAAAEGARMDDAATAGAWMLASRPGIVFENTPNERPRNSARGPPGTTEFIPFLEFKVNGPRLGADGHLWMDGMKCTYYEKGMRIGRASIRVVQSGPPNHYRAL
jgi:hypothetical protein